MTEDGQLQPHQNPEKDTPIECPTCGSTNISESVPGVGPVCEDCGVVLSAPIEIEHSAAEFTRESEQTKTWSEFQSVTNSTEQQVAQAFEILEEIGDRLAVPSSVRERAAEIYTDAAVESLTDGRSTELLVAACLTIAGRECRSPIPAGRIAATVDPNVNAVCRICSELQRTLEHDISHCPPEDYLVNLTRELGLNESIKAVANQILAALPPKSTGGKHPGAMAGAALYVAADGTITQRDVAVSTAVTTETIRLRVNECREASDPESIRRNQEGNNE